MHSRNNAFTLVELILTVAILGVIAAVVYPTFGDSLEAAEERAARTNADSLFAAKQTYKLRVGNAATTFAAASNPDGRYALVQPYLPGAPVSWAAFLGAGHQLDMGSGLNDVVRVQLPDGSTWVD